MDPREKPKIDLIASLQSLEDKLLNCEELSVVGALSCFEEKSALQLWEDFKTKLESGELDEEKFNKIKEKIFKETAGRGHGSVSDQNMFSFCMEDVPRLFTLQICQPEYLAHLQQSLRRATADRGFYIPTSIQESSLCNEAIDILNQTFQLYNEMSANGIPPEDARFVLPLLTKTNILTTGNAREFTHFYDMSTREHMPSTIKEIAGEMINKLRKILQDYSKIGKQIERY